MTKSERHFSPRHIPRNSKLLVQALQTPLLVYFVLAGNFVTFASAALFTFLEQPLNPKVHGYFDGLWWAFSTVTTVGYGDITPVTTAGRLTAMVLMVTGILFFVGFAAVLISAVDTIAAEESSEETVTVLMHELRGELRSIRQELNALREATTGDHRTT